MVHGAVKRITPDVFWTEKALHVKQYVENVWGLDRAQRLIAAIFIELEFIRFAEEHVTCKETMYASGKRD